MPGIAVLMAAAGCSDSNNTTGDPQISADADRTDAGKLETLTVKGKRYTPNGQVLVTIVAAATGGNANPYVEETIQADGSGEFEWKKQPPPCPQPVDYERASYVRVIARDMTGGISSSSVLDPGGQADCP